MNINEKNVIITGGSSGIGLELVKIFLKSNCNVVVASRRIDKLQIKDKRLYAFTCDVSNKKEVDKLFDYAIEKLGRIDIFIANAGFAYYEKIHKANWSHIDTIFKTNVYSVMYSAMKMKEIYENKPYNFVCISSAMGFLSLPGYSLYSATKAALRGFADAYRYELNVNQHFHVVYPIATKTQFFKNAGDAPVPWPTQEADYVAKCIISGIERGKENIYPSKLFKVMYRFLPFASKMYVKNENRKYIKYLKEKAGDK